jgi:GTPase
MLSKRYLDHFIIVINPILGITEKTKIIINAAVNLGLPIVTVISGIDLISNEALDSLIQDYKKFLKAMKFKKLPLLVSSEKDIALFSRNLDEPIHPIFIISCVTGFGLDYFTKFLSLAPSLSRKSTLEHSLNLLNNNSSLFEIQEHFLNLEKKVVVAGFVVRGKICIGQKYFFGPDKTGAYDIVEVESLHCKKVPSKAAFIGQFTTICLKSKLKFNIILYLYFLEEGLTNDHVRKGMVLLDISAKPRAIRKFECEILSLEQEERFIKYKFEPLVTINNIRQCCKIKKQDSNLMTTNQQSIRGLIITPNVSDNEEVQISNDQNLSFKNLKSTVSTTNSSFIGNSNLSNLNNNSNECSFSKQKQSLKPNYFKDTKTYDDDKNDSFKGKVSKSNDGFNLSNTKKFKVTFEFKNFPEYVEVGNHLIVNEPYMKAFGYISRLQFT